MPDLININGNSYPVDLSKEDLAKYPVDYFKGKIFIFDDEEIDEDVIFELYKSPVLGFDCESKPTFRKGEKNRVSLIQLANAHTAVLIRLYSFHLPDEIVNLFESKKVIKAGIGILHDVNKLKAQQQFNPQKLAELNNMAQKAGFTGIGARKLTAALLGFTLNKGAQISNWEANILSKEQIRYAATDAWICHEIYYKLKSFGV